MTTSRDLSKKLYKAGLEPKANIYNCAKKGTDVSRI